MEDNSARAFWSSYLEFGRHFCSFWWRFCPNPLLISGPGFCKSKGEGWFRCTEKFRQPIFLIKVTRAPLNTRSSEPFECKCFHILDMHWWHIRISVQLKIKMCCVILMLKLYKCKWAQGLMGVSSPWTSPFSLPDCRTEICEQFEQPNWLFYYFISFSF